MHPKAIGDGLKALWDLSIPFTWDFSMHPLRKVLRWEALYFQFPLLGIFPCIAVLLIADLLVEKQLSIPFTWDFSMHRHNRRDRAPTSITLSIPFTWDFSMHLFEFLEFWGVGYSFNSLYLGFFHASDLHKNRINVWTVAFNSLYLGFFHASYNCTSSVRC